MAPSVRLVNTARFRLATAGLVIAVTAGLAAAPVGAAPAGAHARGHGVPAALRPAGPRAAALSTLRDLARPTSFAGLLARHAAEARARQALAGDSTGATVGPAGQQSIEMPVAVGPGGDDVLVLTLPDSRPSTLTLRSGRTGAVRWTVKLADAFGVDVARLGPARRPAAVVYQTAFTGTGDPTGLGDTGDQDNSVVTVDLATGKTDWTSTVIHGAYAVSDAGFSEAAALYPAGVLHDRGGDRLLGALVTQSYNIAGSALQQQAVAFDGVTGAMTPLGEPTASDAFGYLEPAGDLNGDGSSDVIQVLGGDSSMVVADSGAAGAPLWIKPTAPAYFVDALPVPDLDGDHHADVLVMNEGGPSGGSSSVTAYTGSAGTLLWSRNADFGFPLGVVSGRGVVALLGLSEFEQITVTAVAGKGTTLWNHTISVPIGGSGGASMEVGEAGDVDADGVDDVFADVAYSGSSGSGHFVALVSGRTGALHTGPSIGAPLYGSLDGHGDDFLKVDASRTAVTLTAFDGMSRHRLWRVSLPAGGMTPFVTGADAVALAGRGRGLVLDMWEGTHAVLMTIGGRSGRRLWTQQI